VLLLGCGASSDERSPSETTSTREVADSDPAAPKLVPPFTVDLPAGWTDATHVAPRKVRLLAESDDASLFGYYVGPTVGGDTVTVIVGRAHLPELVPVEVHAGRIIQSVRTALGARVSQVERMRLDGAAAVTFTDRIPGRPGRGVQRQVIAKDGISGFQVVFTAPPQVFRRYSRDFDRIIRSWRWNA
jgi:hypothetical protein